MSPFDLNQLSAISVAERDQDHTVHPISTLANDASSLSCPIFFRNPHNDHGADGTGFHLQQQLLQQDPKDYTRMISGSSDHRVSCPTSHQDINNKIKLTWCKPYAEEGKLQAPGQWMSSKMRIMKKMLISEYRKPRGNAQITQEQNQTEQGFSTSNCSIKPPTGIIRVCSDCNTTKTPLWRGGPHGPKSLCNACGIRQRKARRAMEAAGVSVGIIHSDTPTKMRREKSDAHRTVPFKKRCKITTASASKKQLCLEDVKICPSTNSTFHEVFPQEERDAAILLMTLSCGLTWS